MAEKNCLESMHAQHIVRSISALCSTCVHMQASVNLATETALVRVLVPRGSANTAGLKALGEQLVQVRANCFSMEHGSTRMGFYAGMLAVMHRYSIFADQPTPVYSSVLRHYCADWWSGLSCMCPRARVCVCVCVCMCVCDVCITGADQGRFFRQCA